ncbi:MAG: ANTAR domain-containing protein [Lachnospiraceae bacterium]|nr:ANTAR domain-containing protein [Lachnospiraceae bacterium]
MGEIIVVFPKKENATNIRNLLVRGGMTVSSVCTTGAQVMHCADMLDEGIVITGYKMSDMLYTDLREYLPATFELLLVASPDKWQEDIMDGVVSLSMPIKAHDLMNTVEMMLQAMERWRKKRKLEKKVRNPGQQALIQKAKTLLMARNNMPEEEAHRYLQKNSMDSGTSLIETAQMVLSIMEE